MQHHTYLPSRRTQIMLLGAAVGAVVGMKVGIAFDGTAVAATMPFAILGAVVFDRWLSHPSTNVAS